MSPPKTRISGGHIMHDIFVKLPWVCAVQSSLRSEPRSHTIQLTPGSHCGDGAFLNKNGCLSSMPAAIWVTILY